MGTDIELEHVAEKLRVSRLETSSDTAYFEICFFARGVDLLMKFKIVGDDYS